MPLIVSWEGDVIIRKGGRDEVWYRVPQWAREYYDERTLKVLCFIDLGKPHWLDLDDIIIVPQEEEIVVNDL